MVVLGLTQLCLVLIYQVLKLSHSVWLFTPHSSSSSIHHNPLHCHPSCCSACPSLHLQVTRIVFGRANVGVVTILLTLETQDILILCVIVSISSQYSIQLLLCNLSFLAVSTLMSHISTVVTPHLLHLLQYRKGLRGKLNLL